MPVPLERNDPRPLVVRRPLAGVTVARSAGDRPLVRGISERFGTTLHLAGRSHWASGRAQWSTAPGSGSVKAPGEVSVERAREGSLAFQSVLFDTALVDEARAVLGSPRVAPRMHAIDPCDRRAEPLRALHRQLLDDEAGIALEEAVCDALHALVDVVCAPRGEPERRSTLSAHVARARAMLDAHLSETIDLESLSAHARIDKFRLCRAFREQVGLPPHAYVTHRRVAIAQGLLARGMTQTEVAARVGFYDQSLLHRHFKRILGFTPGAFVRATT
jgi:AraC-like DNA-binding protein